MTSQRKNILVGLTVLGAFAVLGWMIIQFGGRIGNFAGGSRYTVQMQVPRVDGLVEGNQVRYLGITVGRVEGIRLTDDRTSFMLELGIEPDPPVPANVTGVIRATNFISGGAAIDLQLVDRGDMPDEPEAYGSLQEVADERVLEGTYAGADLVPPEFSTLAEEVRGLVSELRASGMVDNVNQQVEKIGQVADSLNALVGDEQLRGDVKASVASIREASESAARISRELEEFSSRLESIQAEASVAVTEVRQTAEQAGETVVAAREQIDHAGRQVEDVSEQLLGRLAQINNILADVEAITTKIDQGQGTAGRLVNDERLYAQLVDTVRLLETTVATTNRLVEQWEQEGVTVRLR